MTLVNADARFVYVTCSGAAEAQRIGRVLVEERLAACVNVLDDIASIYWWQGAVEEAAEAVLIAKTRDDFSFGIGSAFQKECIAWWGHSQRLIANGSANLDMMAWRR